MLDSLSTIAEIGIGIAGFSGVVVSFGIGARGLAALDRIRVIGLLIYSLGASLLGTLPLVLVEFPQLEPHVWRLSSLVFAAFLFGIVVYGVLASRSTPQTQRAQLHPVMWLLSMVGAPLFAILLAWNASGWYGAPSPGIYLAGLYYLLLFASLQFARLLLVRPGAPPAE